MRRREAPEPGQVARVAEKIGNQCPPRHAIALEPMPGSRATMPVIKDGCVGCGVCEMVCPVEPPAIVIDIDRRDGGAGMSYIVDSLRHLARPPVERPEPERQSRVKFIYEAKTQEPPR